LQLKFIHVNNTFKFLVCDEMAFLFVKNKRRMLSAPV